MKFLKALPLIAVLLPGIAHAQASICAPRAVLAARLLALFKEVPLTRGLSTSGNHMTELYGSPDGKTWSFVVTDTSGVSCIASSGVFLYVIPPPIILEEDPPI